MNKLNVVNKDELIEKANNTDIINALVKHAQAAEKEMIKANSISLEDYRRPVTI